MTGVAQDLWSLALLAVFLVGWVARGRFESHHRDADRDAVDEMALRDRHDSPYWQRRP